MGEEAYQAMLEAAKKMLPLQKVATAEEVAEALVWFLEGAAVVTGEVLIVDSGIHIGQLPPSSSSKADW
jgi:3-oxoacyl-[acyl-carrier protein] reductase